VGALDPEFLKASLPHFKQYSIVWLRKKKCFSSYGLSKLEKIIVDLCGSWETTEALVHAIDDGC